MKNIFVLCFLLNTTFIFCQSNSVEGQVLDVEGTPVSFVNVLLMETMEGEAIQGTSTDEKGRFALSNLEQKEYFISFSYLGYKTKVVQADGLGGPSLEIVLEEDREALDAVVVTAKTPTIKKEPGKLTFSVENTSLSSGNTLSLLAKTPGVTVIQGQIRIKNTSPIVYINDKRVYLSSGELSTLLTNVDASTVKEIEVITNPSAKYDAEGGTILNITTLKAISVGYKGSLSTTYEQGILPKYNIGSSHFYKNNWLNLYAHYGFSPRKEIKKDDNYIRYFEPDGSTQTIWESLFTRRTQSYSHQGNLILDINLGKKQDLSFASNISISPNKKFDNTVAAEMFNAQRQLDSTFRTNSNLENDNSNLSFSGEHQWKLGEKGALLATTLNYILYDNEQVQSVQTDYFLPNGDFLRNNSFLTDAKQESTIYTGQMDLSAPLWEGTIETGWKYSNTDTESGLGFFNLENGNSQFNSDLSDLFRYDESIFAGYSSFSRSWEQWSLQLGLRMEYTVVDGESISLGGVNNQEYAEWFPNGSLQYKPTADHSLGVSYARRIKRPRYQSLNPFLYFLNENNFSGGNPNLIPAIETKLVLEYNFKNKWFFELYYQEFENPLDKLTFQDNENRTLRTLDANLIKDFQYSFDMVYASSVLSWWYLTVVTSSYYLENEFYSIESEPATYSNDTFGFFGQVYSGITLSKDFGLSSDVTAMYISNLIYGSFNYKNQFNLSLSFKKKLWDNRASISAGVDDVFNTNNIQLSSRYYNQDNFYFARPESRLFRLNFIYNFGNTRLRDNNRSTKPKESGRLN